MKRHLFSFYHPAVIFLYFAGVIVLTMCTMHPFYILASYLCCSCYQIYLKGWRQYGKGLRFSLLVAAIITIANSLFHSLGLSVLFYLGDSPITLEAILYGLCCGGMLVCIFGWFSCYQEVMSNDKFLSLFGSILPTISMMIAMVFRYIPDTIRRSKEIEAAQKALLGGSTTDKKERIRQGIRLSSILMSWSLENSIETADSMRSRGFSFTKRSHYCHERLSSRDVLSLLILSILIVLSCLVIFLRANTILFYPFITNLWEAAGIFLIPYLLFMLYPLLLQAKEVFFWRR